jgi:hypothetical protein
MNTTGVKIVMSNDTTLADLLGLNLHEFQVLASILIRLQVGHAMMRLRLLPLCD